MRRERLQREGEHRGGSTSASRLAPLVVVGGCLALVLAGIGTADQEPQPRGAAVVTPCDGCHDEVSTTFHRNPHLHASLPSGPVGLGTVCETCHGDGTRHAEEGDPELIFVPRSVADDPACLTCHGDFRPESRIRVTGLRSAPHPAAGVGCVGCHAIHEENQQAAFDSGAILRRSLLREPVNDLCDGCHPTQLGEHEKPFSHRLDRGGFTCASCHDPHAWERTEASLKRSRDGRAPCFECHADKQGPFVFEHVTDVVGDCWTCHEPHGSNNPMMLVRSTVTQLCLECHSTAHMASDALGSQPPSFHDLRSARYRECTLCHVAVHGSNTSPGLLK
jgi:DmsE family decaheme c-type cytochrome